MSANTGVLGEDCRRERPWSSQLATLLVAGALCFAGFSTNRATASEFSTGVGETRVVALGKGLTVRLNTSTRIRVPASGSRNDFELVAGEILLEVDPGAEGSVGISSGAHVRGSDGARINVKRDGSRTTVVVVKGTATVRHPTYQPPHLKLRAGEETVVTAGQPAQQGFRRVSAIELIRRMAWTEGRLWFEGEPLHEVVAQMNRFNTRRLVIADPSIARISIGGVFEPTDINSFIKALAPLGVQVNSNEQVADHEDVIRLIARIH